MEQTTLADNVTDVETDTRLFITDVETDTRQIDSIHLWHVLVCLVIGMIGIIGNCLTLILFFRRKLWDCRFLTYWLYHFWVRISSQNRHRPKVVIWDLALFSLPFMLQKWTRGLFGRGKYLILYYDVFILDFEKYQAWRTYFKDLCRNGTHDISGDGSSNFIRLRAIDTYSAI